ncbi:MAG: VWA domain-containing protein [Gammaproteobacteria bacterium]|nr:VWA domain-containing protein [Gammaproteobacteria bacterium]
MFDPSSFTTPKAKPLPVVLLLDVSSSMSGEKIDNLNNAVKEMLATLAQEEKMETEILISVITFGREVELHTPFTKASNIKWCDLEVSGATPMGKALEMAKAMIEDKKITPSRAYRPTIVLVSDGQPNDSWESPLDGFVREGRSSKCDRMAMAIGRDADEAILKRFIEGTPHELFTAEGAGQLHEFFQRVTMSVTMRTQSKNPNEVPASLSMDRDSTNTKTENIHSSSVEDQDEGYW